MNQAFNSTNLLCGGMLLLLVAAPVVAYINKTLQPNSRILFGVDGLHPDRPAFVPPSRGMGFYLGVGVPCLLLLGLLALVLFEALPLAMGLLLLLIAGLLILLFRYFQLALRLDREGTTEAAQVREMTPAAATGTARRKAGTGLLIRFTYADGRQAEIRLPAIEEEIDRKELRLSVTYLATMPEVLRVTREASSAGMPAGGGNPPRKIRSGPAAEVLPAALADLAGRESGSFVILGNRRAQRYVQFLKEADALMLDFVLIGLTDAETERSRKFFSMRGIEPHIQGRAKHTVYWMEFPPGDNQVDRAARIAGEILSEVFQIPEGAPIEEFDPRVLPPKADPLRRAPLLPKIFLGIGFFFLAAAILLFGRYAYLMLNRIPVAGEVTEAWQTTCIVSSGETTSEQVCFSARVQFTSEEGRVYRTAPLTRFFRPYQVGERITLFHQPGRPEAAKPDYNDEFHAIALPAGFGVGGIFVGLIFVMADRRRSSAQGQAASRRKEKS